MKKSHMALVDVIPTLWFGFRPAQTQSSLECLAGETNT